MSKKCHICGKEVKENYYLDKRGYTCYTCSKATEKIKELEEKNEQLQSRINDYDVALKTLQDLTERKLKENEQLKQIILFANELIQTQHITQHDYWKFRTLCKENGVDL